MKLRDLLIPVALLLLFGCSSSKNSGNSGSSGNPFERAYVAQSLPELNETLNAWYASEKTRDTSNLSGLDRDALALFKLADERLPIERAVMALPFFLVQDSLRYILVHQAPGPATRRPAIPPTRGPNQRMVPPGQRRPETTESQLIYDSPIFSVYLPSTTYSTHLLHASGTYDSLMNMFLWGDPKGYTMATHAPRVPDSTRYNGGRFLSQSLANLGFSEAPLLRGVGLITIDTSRHWARFFLTQGDGSSLLKITATKLGEVWTISDVEDGGVVD